MTLKWLWVSCPLHSNKAKKTCGWRIWNMRNVWQVWWMRSWFVNGTDVRSNWVAAIPKTYGETCQLEEWDININISVFPAEECYMMKSSMKIISKKKKKAFRSSSETNLQIICVNTVMFTCKSFKLEHFVHIYLQWHFNVCEPSRISRFDQKCPKSRWRKPS